MRGTFSVLAVAAILNGRVKKPATGGLVYKPEVTFIGERGPESSLQIVEGKFHVTGNLTTYFEDSNLYDAIVGGPFDMVNVHEDMDAIVNERAKHWQDMRKFM